MRSRMDRYNQRDRSEYRRSEKNQELYRNIGTNTKYTNFTDVTNANAFDLNRAQKNYRTREGYQQMKEYEGFVNEPKEKKELEDFNEAYGSETYGFTAYILSKIRIYSIPFCFVGIAVGAIYQYVIGIRKLDVRDRGMILIVSFVTLLVICQVLPLVFTIVVRGWRS